MSSKKLCSILIPSRRRLRGLRKTLDSIAAATHDPNAIEVLIRFDHDDTDWILDGGENPDAALGRDGSHKLYDGVEDRWARWPFEIEVNVGSRMRGFASLNVMYQELSEIAAGDFIFILNDDAHIATMSPDGTKWDRKLADFPPNGDYLIHFERVWNNQCHYDFVEGGPFPIVRNRGWYTYETQCLGDPVDTWLDKILVHQRGWTSAFLTGCQVFHDRNEDEIKEHRK